jgi:hypothetical protein
MDRGEGFTMSRKHLAVVVVLGAALLVSAQPASTDGPFQYYPLTPCRAVDTRNTYQSQGGYGPGLVSGERRPFPIQGNCLVPVGAKAMTVNVTVVKPSNQSTLYAGYLSIYPTGGTPPLVSVINWATGTTAIANGAIVPLADQSAYPNDVTVKAALSPSKGKVDVILDVTGYFE